MASHEQATLKRLLLLRMLASPKADQNSINMYLADVIVRRLVNVFFTIQSSQQMRVFTLQEFSKGLQELGI